jgi:nitrate/nitrite transporter NarK
LVTGNGDAALYVCHAGLGGRGGLFGKLADDYGARRVILGGILLMAAGFFGMSLSSNVWQLSLTYGLMVGLAGRVRTGNRVALGVAALRAQEPRPGSERAANFGTSKPAPFRCAALFLDQPFWLARRRVIDSDPAHCTSLTAGMGGRTSRGLQAANGSAWAGPRVSRTCAIAPCW